MKTSFHLAFLAATSLFFSCAGPRIDARRDLSVDASGYKTYQWIGDAQAQSLRLGNPPQIDFITGSARVVRLPAIEVQLKGPVDHELRARGFNETAAVPDFYVTFYGKARDQDWVSTWSGYAPSVSNIPIIMYPNYDRVSARTYREGNILLVFYDARTKRPCWSGTMTGVLSGKEVDLKTVTADLSTLVDEFKKAD